MRSAARAAVTCLAALTAFATTEVVAAGPAAADPAQLEVSAQFDKPIYHTGELITITVRVKNIGTATASGLHAINNLLIPTELKFDPTHAGELFGFGPGLTLEPGATHETTLSGHQGKPDADTVTLTGNIFDQSGFGVAPFAFSAPITLTTSHVAGTIFGDRNGNGTFDSGEELPGVALTLRYTFNFQFSLPATTDAAGRFDFGDIPTVAYSTDGTAPGFLFPFTRIDIDAAKDNTNLLFRAVPPLNGALHASVKFTKNQYQPGDLARMKVTLSNSGSIPLTGIVANCNRSGEGSQLSGTGPGWGALANGAGGVTINPGSTSVFAVSETVPGFAIDFGYIGISCDFGYQGADDLANPQAGDTARVPGGVATFLGRVIVSAPEPGQPLVGVPGVRAVLVRHHHVAGRATSDGNGDFQFGNLAPSPDYQLTLTLPAGFTIGGQNPFSTSVQVVANRDFRFTFVAERR